MIEALIGVIGVVIGIIVGFALNERATREREKRTEKKQINAVRTLVGLEIEQNLKLLHGYWGKVSEPKQDVDHDRLRLALRLTNLPLSRWSRKMFESQIPLFPMALSQEEIMQVNAFYNDLERLEVIHSALLDLQREQNEDWRAARGQDGVARSVSGLSKFNWNAPGLSAEFVQVVYGLLDMGQSLRVRLPTGT